MERSTSLPAVFLIAALVVATPAGGAVASVWRAARTSDAIAVDGALDEPAWATAPPITGFTQRDPDEGKPATEATTVRILYDDDAIYVGAMMADSGPVTGQLGRRDTLLESDWFTLYLDPHHDRRSGAAFGVNPSNVQTDMVLYDDNSSDSDWDAVWSSATRVDGSGWTAEMRIPYSQLRFPNRPVHVWGINVIREIARKHEASRLVFTPKTESGFVSRFGDLEGIEGIAPKRALELMPYAAVRSDRRETLAAGDPFRSTTEVEGAAGLDLKYGLTSNLTLTGTLNPDFGQVEVDPAEVNLSQYELFYNEKRPFFLEGSSLFSFGRGGSNNSFGLNFSAPSVFYSRRIGRPPQGTPERAYDYLDAPGDTTILGALKLTGKTASGWTIAALDALTDRETARFRLDSRDGEVTIEPATNYLVTRVAKDIGTKGRVGGIVTAVNRDLDEATAGMREEALLAGVDGHWFFGDRHTILEWSLLGTTVRGSEEAIARTQRAPAHQYQRPDATHVELDPGRTSLDGWGTRVMAARQKGIWRWNVQAQAYSPGFETNDAGFMQRADAVSTHAVVLFNDPRVGRLTRRRFFWAGGWQNYNFAGDVIDRGFGGSGNVTLKNYGTAWLELFHSFETLDDRATRGGPLVRQQAGSSGLISYTTDDRNAFWVDSAFGVEKGAHSDLGQNAFLTLNYRPSPAVSVSLGPRWSKSHGFAQYVAQRQDPLATATYGARYLFSRIEQESLELTTRLDWTFSPRLTLQFYLQPYVASGDYHEFKEVARPRSLDFLVYGTGASTIDRVGAGYLADPDGPGPAAPFTFGDPDFNFRSLRGSAVLRWEFRPGSALYVVWNENRADAVPLADLRPRRDLSALADVPSDDVLMVKASYWFGR